MDMLVPLYKLPPMDEPVDRLRKKGIVVRRANSFEITPIRKFVTENFNVGWADEISPCFSRQPLSLYVALSENKLVGFGAYETTRRNFFGPTGVANAQRKGGIGTALLLACLHGMKEMGYAYAIIGGVGPAPFYERIVGAVPIEGSSPGIYVDPLR